MTTSWAGTMTVQPRFQGGRDPALALASMASWSSVARVAWSEDDDRYVPGVAAANTVVVLTADSN